MLNKLARPFSIGAALIDYGNNEFKDGARVSKHVLKQLENIDELIDIPSIRINGTVSGRQVEMSVVFQIHPLTIDYERKKAFHSITAGLFIMPEMVGGEIVTTTPADWLKNDQETLWHELFQEVAKLTDLLIPKAETQTSVVLSINAHIEIPFALLNEAQKKVMDAFCQIGQLRDINMQSIENNQTPAPKGEDTDEMKQQEATQTSSNNPWASGSFFLFAFVIIIVLLAVLAKVLPIWFLAPIILGGLLSVTIIGAFQLRNDSKIEEKNFLILMKLAFQKIPLLGKLLSKNKPK